MQTADKVISKAMIIPRPGEDDVIDPGYIAIKDGAIADFGPMSEATAWVDSTEEVLEAPWAVIVPGLVNVHTHLAGAIFRGLLDEGSKGRGLYDIAFPMEQSFEPEDIYWLGMLGCIEVLKAGCTTVNDIFYFSETLAEVIDKVGLRAVLAEKMFDADLPSVGDGDYTRSSERRSRKLEANVRLIEQWHGAANGRITCRMGTHATDTCSKGFLEKAKAEADRLNVGMHIHVAQSPIEVNHIKSTHGCTPIEYLDQLGVLGEDTLTVHCFLNNDADNDRMAETNTAYACCPAIYPRRGRFPSLWEFQDRGIRTGFGTDWIRMDPWEGMRNAMYSVRLLLDDPEALPSHELLKLQTVGSAEALKLDDHIGTIDIGKRADLVLIDTIRPHLQPFYRSLPGLIYNVYPSDVHTVMVDGQEIVRSGEITTVNEERVLEEIQSRIPRYNRWRENLSV